MTNWLVQSACQCVWYIGIYESYLALKLASDSRVLALVLVSRVQASALALKGPGLGLDLGLWILVLTTTLQKYLLTTMNNKHVANKTGSTIDAKLKEHAVTCFCCNMIVKSIKCQECNLLKMSKLWIYNSWKCPSASADVGGIVIIVERFNSMLWPCFVLWCVCRPLVDLHAQCTLYSEPTLFAWGTLPRLLTQMIIMIKTTISIAPRRNMAKSHYKGT